MEPLLSRQITKRGPVANAHFVEHIGDVRAYCARRDIQLHPDLLVAFSACDKAHDLEFAPGESVETG